MAIDCRHYHYIVRLCRKITVNMLLRYSWMKWRFYIVFKICRYWRIMLLLVRYTFLCISTWSLQPALLKSSICLISYRYIMLILSFWGFKLRLCDRWIFIFLSINKRIINLISWSSICFIKVSCLWSWSQLLLSIH